MSGFSGGPVSSFGHQVQTRQKPGTGPQSAVREAQPIKAAPGKEPATQDGRRGDQSATTERGIADLVGNAAMIEKIATAAQTVTEPVPDAVKTSAKKTEDWSAVRAGRRLKRGMRGPLVRELQERLAAAGFACGSEGEFNAEVEAAVLAFQAAKGLTADGAVDRETAAAL